MRLLVLLAILLSCSLALADEAPGPRTMIIVAHQDDDIPIMYPDLAAHVNPRTPMQTVYLTNGNAGLRCGDYTRGREQGVKQIHAQLVGVDDVWSDEERTVNGKLLRVSTLRGTQHQLVFFGFANSPEEKTSLEYLWSEPEARISTMDIDGRSHVDSYSADELVETLRALMVAGKVEDVRMLDATQRKPEFYPFDHTDHVHSALFGFAALERYGESKSFTMYRGYNIQFEPKNLAKDVIEKREKLFKAYAEHDKKICPMGKVELCGEKTRCFPLGMFLPFQARRYTITQLIHDDTPIRTQFARCLDVQADDAALRVQTVRCDDASKTQRWALEANGTVRHLARGQCLTAKEPKLGSGLTLAPCKHEPAQRFYMTSQGQLRGPDASCVRSGLRDPELQACGLRMRQAGWRLLDERSTRAR